MESHSIHSLSKTILIGFILMVIHGVLRLIYPYEAEALKADE